MKYIVRGFLRYVVEAENKQEAEEIAMQKPFSQGELMPFEVDEY